MYLAAAMRHLLVMSKFAVQLQFCIFQAIRYNARTCNGGMDYKEVGIAIKSFSTWSRVCLVEAL